MERTRQTHTSAGFGLMTCRSSQSCQRENTAPPISVNLFWREHFGYMGHKIRLDHSLFFNKKEVLIVRRLVAKPLSVGSKQALDIFTVRKLFNREHVVLRKN